ncbi:zinc-ribbon domain-containing protein [Lentilactobacillus senioris]|uniref:zinc ribbon domain-containing protein n=1 Tax=Lentilactobacillus senioris TaxID=931534 RepID=UPI00227F457D|nr:zinc-ribbon domain-containing protein [Lentilactobacillus senioris]MCY9806166.1 zinc-ribbon domain-containing protein [Lentilactobacillus senioris]
MENSVKFCPKCGNQIEGEVKFCPKCGYSLMAEGDNEPDNISTTTQVQETPTEPVQATNDSENSVLTNAKDFTGNYFSWFWETIKHPSRQLTEVNRWFGVLSFVLEAFLIALVGLTIMNKLKKAVIYNGGPTAERALDYSNANGKIFEIFLLVFIAMILGYLVYISISYGFHRIISTAYTNFWDFVNRFAELTNLTLIFNFVLLVLFMLVNIKDVSFLGIDSIASILIMTVLSVASLVWTVAYILVLVADYDGKNGADKFYICLLAELALVVGIGVFSSLVFTTIGNSIIGYAGSLGQSIF